MSLDVRLLAMNLINLFTTVVEGILGLRFLLKLFGATVGNDFVNWVYEMSGGLLEPFRGVFPARVFENQYVLEFTTVFAMVMYAILALVLVWLVATVSPDTTVVRKRR